MPPGMLLHEGVWTGCGSCGKGASCPFLFAGAQAVCVVSGCRTGDQERLGRKRAAGRTRQPALRRSDCKRPPDMTRSKPGFRASDRRSPYRRRTNRNTNDTFRATSVAGGEPAVRATGNILGQAPRSTSGGTINRAPFSRAREKVPRECEADDKSAVADLRLDEGSHAGNDQRYSECEGIILPHNLPPAPLRLPSPDMLRIPLSRGAGEGYASPTCPLLRCAKPFRSPSHRC